MSGILETVDDHIDADLTHSLHTSERKSYRGCRVRWNWLFRGYYYPKTTAKPLEFGVAYHKAMETLYEPQFWNRPREVVLELAIQTFRQKCKAQFDKYVEYFGPAEPDVKKDYEERKALGEGMLRYHNENILPEFAEEYRPVKVEVSFEVPVSDDNNEQLWCTCENCMKRLYAYRQTLTEAERLSYPYAWRRRGLPVTYGGRVDCVMEKLEDGSQWIFDWKTAAQLSEDRQEFLLLDDQISSYVWAFRVLGIDCAGFVYVEQKKSDGSEPEPLKVVRLGRRFSTSKSSVSASAEVYQRTVAELDTEAYESGLYDDFIDYLRDHNKQHAIYTEYRNDHEIATTGQAISDEAQEMIDPKLRIYANAGRFSCGNCAFRQPCLERAGGGDYVYALETMFEKRKYHYWVDTEASTESKGGQ